MRNFAVRGLAVAVPLVIGLTPARCVSPIRLATLLLLLICAWAAPSEAVPFNLTAGGDFGAGGNKGTSISDTNAGLTLTLSARTTIPDGDPNLFASGSATGTVFISLIGAGVQTNVALFGKTCPPDCVGFAGISGTGPQQDEALILTFSTPIITSLTTLVFTAYEIANDGVLIYLDSTTTPTLSTATIEAALVCVILTCTLDFSSLAGLPASFTTLYARADGDSRTDEDRVFFVGSLDASPVPEPSTLVLLGSALTGLGLWRGRRWLGKGPSQN